MHVASYVPRPYSPAYIPGAFQCCMLLLMHICSREHYETMDGNRDRALMLVHSALEYANEQISGWFSAIGINLEY